ncbi:MAG: GGDEF domain-containing protein [Deltaproteobacteria bacterium]|nr:GGDEF domain-containing protein [Deltaproteobacteria bacterium]
MHEPLSHDSMIEVGRRVREAQARDLLEQGGTGAVGSSLAGIFVTAGLYGEDPRGTLLGWLAVLLALQVGRLLLAYAVTGAGGGGGGGGGGHRVQRWARVNLWLIAGTALTWGVGVYLLWPESTLHQVMLPMTVVGLSAAAIIGYAPVRAASYSFGVLAIMPLAARFIAEGTTAHIIIGFLALLYVALTLRLAVTMRETSTRALTAGFENEILAAKAEAASEELAKKTALLEELVRLDGLTQIANRREFDEVFGREWRRASRASTPVSVLMADIDHFKRFNDSYGHLAGDDCLRAVAQSLKGALQRATDMVARYGGEEFVAVLADTNLESAMVTAERLREQVAALEIPHSDSAAGSYVTVSIGVATVIPGPNREPASLVEAADDALYEAKKGGRNRVASRSEKLIPAKKRASGQWALDIP